MREFYCENQGGYTYLVYEASSGENIDRLGLGMMTNNKIKGFLPLIYTQLDGKNRFKYNISAKVSLSQYTTGTLSRHKLLTIFRTIVEAALTAEEYMIESATVLFDPEYIYVDVTTAEVGMICLPLDGMEQQDLGTFFKDIMYNGNMRYDASENCDYVVKIINFLNSSSVFSPESFKKLIFELDQPEKQAGGANAKVIISQYPSKEEIISTVKASDSIGQKLNSSEEYPYSKDSVVENADSSRKNISENVEHILDNTPIEHHIQENMDMPFEIPGGTEVVEPASKNSKKKFSLFGSNNKKTEKQKEKERKKQEKKEKKESFFGKRKEEEKKSGENLIIQPPEISSQHYQKPLEEKNVVDFGATVLFDEEAEKGTVFLGGEKESSILVSPRLIRVKNNQVIPIDSNPFKIGHAKDFADYYIGDNPAISRSHAMIIRRGEDYFIVDTNSKNHTYVDGQLIVSNSEVPISHKTRIRLADEDFTFEIF